jgi:hypothetical protein
MEQDEGLALLIPDIQETADLVQVSRPCWIHRFLVIIIEIIKVIRRAIPRNNF